MQKRIIVINASLHIFLVSRKIFLPQKWHSTNTLYSTCATRGRLQIVVWTARNTPSERATSV